ncbi:hypothetical protein LC1Hm_4009 (plasmid) [Halomicrobium sp. LC1Hm]|nr:hypothetical protein LC1Hm_4009 [Halomicrobium sp. LC1Hm]
MRRWVFVLPDRPRDFDILEFCFELIEGSTDCNEFVVGSGPQTPVEQHIASSYRVSSVIGRQRLLARLSGRQFGYFRT